MSVYKADHVVALEFDSEKETLRIVAQHEAKGSHSWLALNVSLLSRVLLPPAKD